MLAVSVAKVKHPRGIPYPGCSPGTAGVPPAPPAVRGVQVGRAGRPRSQGGGYFRSRSMSQPREAPCGATPPKCWKTRKAIKALKACAYRK